MCEVNVSEKEFKDFVKLQDSGKYNMMDSKVRILCCISRAQHIYIMEHYDELYEKYMEGDKS